MEKELISEIPLYPSLSLRNSIINLPLLISLASPRNASSISTSHDEMNRGLFTEMAELKKHGGKIAEANKVLIPAMAAVKFPDLEVNFSDGKTMKLPVRISDVVDADKLSVPKASLVCLSFRANSQEMINSWSMPFVEAFSKSEGVHLYQVSFIDSWLLCRYPIKRLLLWTMKKPNHDESKDTLQRQMVYSFGDHYYFRKELRILNTLTGYIFLLDNFGRVRWQGFGSATKDEVMNCLPFFLAHHFLLMSNGVIDYTYIMGYNKPVRHLWSCYFVGDRKL